MFVFAAPPPPSPRAQELAEKMADLIRIFRESDPDLTMTDVRQAAQLAGDQVRSEMGGAMIRTPVLVALLIGLALAGLLIFLFLHGSGIASMQFMIMVIIALIAVGTGIAFIAARR